VYPLLYGFNVGETALVFVCIIVGCFIAVAIHFSYLNWYLIPDILKNGLRQQEHRLVPAIFASFGPPIGLFLFGESMFRGKIDKTVLISSRLDCARFNTLDSFGRRHYNIRSELLHPAAIHLQ
jgi:hypothetical protein